MVNHQTRLPFGEYVVLIFPTTKHANLRRSCLESSIRSGLQEEAQDSMNLCKFGASVP